jgi:hypothetical protein
MTAIRPAAPILTALLCAVLLFGCAKPAPPSARFPDITFQQFPTYNFKVGRIEIVREYTPPMRAPNVDHLSPEPPIQMAEQWARDRLRATGGPGTLRFVIKRASIVESELPRTTGIRGAFTTDQAQRYEGVVEVEIEVRGERGYRDGFVSARAEQRQTVGEDISLAGRERTWFTMTETMGRDLNVELDRNIQANLQRFLSLP